ncbi:hypothetical protein K443DRAFT_10646 [Laccaria amethystina LaAM-08-1]|uniref:Uncharacterized protein n=1 Tax=Laccaria amethystina LaAM-08-1 TaxID=1095629 RepID=A0A0C9X591_9AGAR|nr:hypothetical protein K443DRAFT_10646 [Laccaria amethystina LaAM-08-1]
MSIMGAKVKGKCAITHTDPYAGGEQSGRKAKPDARQPLIDIGVPQAMGAEAVPISTTTPLFNPAAIDLNDLVALPSLKCLELNKVANFHNQKAAGTNEAIVKCLHALAMSTPPSSAPIPPPSPVLAAHFLLLLVNPQFQPPSLLPLSLP